MAVASIANNLAPLITPVGGGFKAIQTAASMAAWLVGNVNQVTEMVNVANSLIANVDLLRAPTFDDAQKNSVPTLWSWP